jgi:glycosyltransferase involved in cell wall biosynthesis
MNKAMEYMALKKPIVAFDLVETRFSAQDAALYAPPNDEAGFAQRIEELLDDPLRCERMGEAGALRVARSLAWEYSIPHLLQAYLDLCGRADANRTDSPTPGRSAP